MLFVLLLCPAVVLGGDRKCTDDGGGKLSSEISHNAPSDIVIDLPGVDLLCVWNVYYLSCYYQFPRLNRTGKFIEYYWSVLDTSLDHFIELKTIQILWQYRRFSCSRIFISKQN